MGWKTIKEYYNIPNMIVHKDNNYICIGTDFINDLIRIKHDGTVLTTFGYDFYHDDFLCDLYHKISNNSKEKNKELFDTTDKFEINLVVYTFDSKYEIVEKFCENYEYPNVTHDGCLMYEKLFFKKIEDCVKIMKNKLNTTQNYNVMRLKESNDDMIKFTKEIEVTHSLIQKLNAKYPNISHSISKTELLNINKD